MSDDPKQMTPEEMHKAALDRIGGEWEADIYPTLEDAKAGKNSRPATEGE